MKSAKDFFADAERLEQQGKYKDAILVLDKAILKDPQFIGAYINRGADKSALEDYNGAIEDYLKATTLDPGNVLALFNIGNNYKRLNDFNSAINYYNKAFAAKGGGERLYIDFTPNNFVDLDKSDVPGHEIAYERAIAFYQMDSLKRAYADFQHSMTNGYMTAACYQWIGYIFLRNRQKEKACECFQKAKSLGSNEVDSDINKYCKG